MKEKIYPKEDYRTELGFVIYLDQRLKQGLILVIKYQLISKIEEY